MEMPLTNHQVLQTELPHVEEADFKKHPRRFLNKKLLAKLIYFFPLLIGAGVVYITVDELWISVSVAVVWLVLLIFTLFVSYKEYFVRGYVLREQDITYKRGWLFHHQVTVPFNRIQHTEISHGPIDRLFQLKELEIYTAGGSSSDLNISGLDPQEAEKLKEFIADKVASHA
jgi:membrane protein YdbS with pleckstrin-like domain